MAYYAQDGEALEQLCLASSTIQQHLDSVVGSFPSSEVGQSGVQDTLRLLRKEWCLPCIRKD